MNNKENAGKYSNPLKATVKGIADLFQKREKDAQVQLNDSDNLQGKNVLITGASSGLGFATAKLLAEKGANLIMACRSGIPEKGLEIQKLTGNNNVKMLGVDLSDLDSIQELVLNIKKETNKIDILICNAAIVPKKSRKTRQGLEEMLVVNYLAKYLLVRLMLKEHMFNTKDNIPRIIFVSSESHRNPASFEWGSFGKYKDYGINKTVELYGYYKLLLTTFANELSRKLNEKNSITYSVFALCPGPVNTNIAREAPTIFKPLLKFIFWLFFRSPEKASLPVLYFAQSNEVEGKRLDYLFLMNRTEMDSKAMEPENGKRLWEISEVLLNQQGFDL